MNRYNRRYIAAPDIGSQCRNDFDGSTLLLGIGRATLLLTVAANRGIVHTEYRRLKRGGAPLALYALKPKPEVRT